jgi:hypothetical protein
MIKIKTSNSNSLKTVENAKQIKFLKKKKRQTFVKFLKLHKIKKHVNKIAYNNELLRMLSFYVKGGTK